MNHLRKHPKPGVQNLALKVQKELTKQKELFQLEGNIPSVEEVFKHYVIPRKVSVPVKKKTSKEKPNQLKDKIANTVVYEYLKTHQKSGVRQLALELQKEVPILLNEKVPSFQELYNPAVPPRKILVAVRKKVSNQNPKQLNEPKPSVSNPDTKSKVLTTNYSYGSGEKVVPIKDVFKNRVQDIEVFKQDKPEVYKVLKYIWNSDIKVMKNQADTNEIKSSFSFDRVQYRKIEKDLFVNKVKLGKFSSANYGENSEETRIVNALHDLFEGAGIIDTKQKQVIQDFENLMNEQCT